MPVVKRCSHPKCNALALKDSSPSMCFWHADTPEAEKMRARAHAKLRRKVQLRERKKRKQRAALRPKDPQPLDAQPKRGSGRPRKVDPAETEATGDIWNTAESRRRSAREEYDRVLERKAVCWEQVLKRNLADDPRIERKLRFDLMKAHDEMRTKGGYDLHHLLYRMWWEPYPPDFVEQCWREWLPDISFERVLVPPPSVPVQQVTSAKPDVGSFPDVTKPVTLQDPQPEPDMSKVREALSRKMWPMPHIEEWATS